MVLSLAASAGYPFLRLSLAHEEYIRECSMYPYKISGIPGGEGRTTLLPEKIRK
jgi:hypothetical protein